MGDEHKTKEVDQLAVIRGLITNMDVKSDARFDALHAKVDAHRAESKSRGEEQSREVKELSANVGSLDREVQGLGRRMSEAEFAIGGVKSDIRELRDKDSSIERQQSNTDMEREREQAAIIEHTTAADRRAHVQGVMIEAVFDELGLDRDKVIAAASEGGDRPSERVKLAPSRRSTLARLSRENKAGLIGSAFTILILILQVVVAILAHGALPPVPLLTPSDQPSTHGH